MALLRHGPTAWNEAGRIQGHSDTPLSPRGRAHVLGWRLPDWAAGAQWHSSPLRRAVETAAILGVAAPRLDERLMEMAWGEFEGRTLAELRQTGGATFAAREALGLDFQPPGGESPRMVTTRLHAFLRSLAGDPGGTADGVVAVAHKGVLRAALVLGTGWDMLGQPPLLLGPEDGLVMELDASGSVHALRRLELGPEASL